MGNSISCHQPCCRWTTDVDGELAVEGKRLGKPGEEEPKMNFDTNVIGPANINLIGGGTGLQLQQELKLFEDSRFSRPQPRDNSRGRSSSPKEEENVQPPPVAKASFDTPRSKEASRPAPSRPGNAAPSTQSAKQFADAFSREVRKIDRERVNKNTKPRFQDNIRIMPTAAWSKLYAAFPRATSPAKSQPAPVPTPSAPVQKTLHSIVPAQWSSYHRHWTGQKTQKTVAEMAIAAIAIPEIPNSAVAIASASITKLAKDVVKQAVTKQLSALSSLSPAMWSPLHRKWCGHEGLKPVKTAGSSGSAIQKLVLAKDCGLLPGLASSMLDAALNIEVKVEAKELVKAKEAPKLSATGLIVKCSVAPAVYSIYHRHWTGGRAR